MQTKIRRRVLRHLIWVALFANVPVNLYQITLFTGTLTSQRQNSAVINNRDLDFKQSCGSVSLVINNHVGSHLLMKLLRGLNNTLGSFYAILVQGRESTFVTSCLHTKSEKESTLKGRTLLPGGANFYAFSEGRKKQFVIVVSPESEIMPLEG